MAAPPHWPVVARQRDLSRLDALVQAAATDRHENLIVVAEGGGGKTNALNAVAAEAVEAGLTVLRASAAGRPRAGAVVEDLLGPDADADLGAHLVRLEGAGGPVAVLVDNADRADVESLQALADLARRSRGQVGLIAVSVVSEASPGTIDVINALRADGALGLRLMPLRMPEIGDLLAQAGLGGDGDQLAQSVLQVTGGNPGYVMDLVDELEWRGADPATADADLLDGLVPDSTIRAVRSRLAALPDDAALVMDAVFTLGDHATAERVSRLTDLGLDDLPTLFAALAGAGLLDGGTAPRLRAPIVGRALEFVPSGADRGVMRSRAAKLLRDQGAPLEAVLQQLHLAEPGSTPGGADMLIACARAALTAGQPAEAERHLIRLVSEPDAASTAEGRLLLIAVQVALHRPHAWERLHELLGGFATDQERAERLEDLGDLLLMYGRRTEAERVFGHALALTRQPGVGRALRGRLEIRRSWAALQLPMDVPAPTAGGGTGHLTAEDTARRALLDAVTAAQAGRPHQEVLALLDEHRSGGPATGPHAAEAAELSIAVLVWCDALSDARRACEARLGRADDEPLLRSAVRAEHAVLGLAEGDLLVAVAQADAVPVSSGALRRVRSQAAWAGALAELQLGNVKAANKRLSAWVSGPEPELVDARVMEARGWIELAQERPEAAARWFDASTRLAERIGVHNPAVVGSPLGTAAALAMTGETAQARRVAEATLHRARAFGAPAPLAAALRIWAGTASREAALTALQEALDLLEGTHAHILHARVLLSYGETLHRANRRAAAREPLSLALDIATRHGARMLAERIEAELKAAGARPRRALLTGVASLTAAERLVADRVAAGLTNSDVAEALVVTPKTIEWHLGHVYSKLRISGRHELREALELDSTQR